MDYYVTRTVSADGGETLGLAPVSEFPKPGSAEYWEARAKTAEADLERYVKALRRLAANLRLDLGTATDTLAGV